MSHVRCTFCDEMNPPTQRNCRSCGAELPGAQSLADSDVEPDALTMEVVQIAREQGTIAAIKHYREITDADLAEAKAAVEAMIAGASAEASKPKSAVEEEILPIIREHGKIAAIKRYRELTGLGLREAKDYVEGLMARTGTTAGRSSAGCGSYVLALLLAGIGLTVILSAGF